ncbi:MAG: signal recognition particle-docking protein FtsY [Lachnospiraceae bacterium]|jgi:fused signal recognition particle receptor|nr:signal recognition particle-docking protein FtsY [Lachnospiraceae bacterium]MDD4524555.1 signal recognition particle-docking protein FtsY [Lachnospiraceae bacterium]
METENKENEETLESPKKKGFFARLRAGLAKTRDSIAGGFDHVFTDYQKIDDDFYEGLEETMIMGDIGVSATDRILSELREQVSEQHITETSECRQLLIDNIRAQMTVDEHAYDFEKGPAIVLVIGVNGVGKTTSVGKLAGIYKEQGKKVLIAAADTFRAAAGEQLSEWAKRAGVDMISAREGSDPASVIFDSVQAAKARRTDILLCDTAGRLHNKKNLMEELRKMDRIITKEYPEAIRENLVVLDGTTGQNALSQAREFADVTDLTGIILTKMDGTAKGGIAIAVQSELDIPVKFIGIGEKMDDLQRFHPDEFVDALFDNKEEKTDEQ